MGSHNCNVDTALQEMLTTKWKYGKLDKRQGYHFIISFKMQEVRPETAMEITQKFVEKYFGDDFQCLYATHDNTEHVHSYILFNSVSWRTGKKYRYEKGDWAKEIQPIVNELCKEYGLSIQDMEIGTEKETKKWDKTKQGIFKWNHQISMDVEDSISFANNYDNFLKLMELKGYEIRRQSGRDLSETYGRKAFYPVYLFFFLQIINRTGMYKNIKTGYFINANILLYFLVNPICFPEAQIMNGIYEIEYPIFDS